MVDAERSRWALPMGLALCDLSVTEMSAHCAGLGIDLDHQELAAILGAQGPRTARDHDAVAIALDEYLEDVGLGRPVPFRGAAGTVPATTASSPGVTG